MSLLVPRSFMRTGATAAYHESAQILEAAYLMHLDVLCVPWYFC